MPVKWGSEADAIVSTLIYLFTHADRQLALDKDV